MGKQAKKEVKKVFQLLTTAQSNAYKQQVKKQGSILYEGSGTQLQSLLGSTAQRNYLQIYKKTANLHKQVHPLDDLEQRQRHYDPKTKDRSFNIKKELPTHQAYEYPVTANQQYGWRQPIDVFPTKFGMKQTFDQKLLTTLKVNKPAPKK